MIHLDDRSTDFLKPIYAGKGYPVISGSISREALLAEMQKYSRLYMLGHGSPSGLFARNFLIGDAFGPEIASKRDGLYIWCNADAYAKRNRLSGLVSGMFISEVGEARMFGIEATQEEVDFSNDLFAATVRAVLDEGAPPSAVRERYTHATNQMVKFNNERLYIFDQGNPTPALHPTSLAHPPAQPEWGAKRLLRSTGQEMDFQDWQDRLEYYAYARDFPVWQVLEDLGVDDAGLFRLFTEGHAPEEVVELLRQTLEGDGALATDGESFDDDAPERLPHGRF